MMVAYSSLNPYLCKREYEPRETPTPGDRAGVFGQQARPAQVSRKSSDFHLQLPTCFMIRLSPLS